MTDAELKEIAARCSRATASPFTWDRLGHCLVQIEDTIRLDDVEFIIHARYDMNLILQELRNTRELLEQINSMCDKAAVQDISPIKSTLQTIHNLCRRLLRAEL